MQKITFPRAGGQEQRVEVNAGSWHPEAKQQPAICLPHSGGGEEGGAMGVFPIICFGAEHKRASVIFTPEVGLGAMQFIIPHVR